MDEDSLFGEASYGYFKSGLHYEQPLTSKQRNVPCFLHQSLSDREQPEISYIS